MEPGSNPNPFRRTALVWGSPARYLKSMGNKLPGAQGYPIDCKFVVLRILRQPKQKVCKRIEMTGAGTSVGEITIAQFGRTILLARPAGGPKRRRTDFLVIHVVWLDHPESKIAVSLDPGHVARVLKDRISIDKRWIAISPPG